MKNYFKDLNVSPRTQGRKLGAIRRFWSYVHDQMGIEEIPDPFKNVLSKIRKDNKPLWDRLAFTTEEVRALYDAAEGQDLKDLIKIGAYTGMRIEEICSKSRVVGDVFEIRGGKTKASDRSVPIHRSLQDGTLDRWESTKQTLRGNKYGQSANPLGRRFGRLRDNLGLSQEYQFHCLRHTVATELVNSYPEQYLLISLLLGHRISEVERNVTLTHYAKLRGERHRELVESLDYGF
jgi:integrase